MVTAFCLWDLGPGRFVLGHSISQVEFLRISQKEIEDYVNTGEPMDKAGSYGIQGEAKKFVKQFSGSYENIVGLPIDEVEKVILDNGWKVKN